MEKYEDRNICSSCGGLCCKKSGCDYYVEDFPSITKNEILKVLSTGSISIVGAVNIQRFGKKSVASPILYLRARNKDRDIIDLFSMKKTCSMLTDSGCSYDLQHRPSGGASLIPKKNSAGFFHCAPAVNQLEALKKWLPYQNLLGKIVKRYTGKSVDEVFKEDVERVFYEVLAEQFEGVTKLEVRDISETVLQLIDCFPREFKNASDKYKNSTKIYTKKRN